MEILYEPWPWYVSGPLIAMTMAVLILLGKRFGMSSNLETLCSMGGAGRFVDYFKVDTQPRRWNLTVVVGAIIGGFIAANYLSSDNQVAISERTSEKLKLLGFKSNSEAYLPTELFSIESFSEPKTLLILIVGGFLVGFGARYAGGCTSGHAISGLSDLQLPSLIAVIGFFAGGLIMVHLLFPLIF